MLRISELKLPLDHPEDALEKLILKTLRIDAEALQNFVMVKKSIDARHKSDIMITYIVDADVEGEDELLKRFKKNNHINPAPDMSYSHKFEAPKDLTIRPIVIGFG
ncbi:MAG: hypothetical protein HRT89_04405, partial [Lentisphaeria bacterium]|nr:hypothetical protein [Lentisphaeria bacterium]NQZ67288.1 hypothetical protein [Lentisphaeria bacterium]